MSALRPYIKLMLRYPLNLFAAFFAAMLGSFLLTMGPGIIKVFMAEAVRGAEQRHLVMIAIILLTSLLLSFVFEIIQGHIAKHLKLQIETDLRIIYQRYCQFHKSSQREMAHGRGIFAVSGFCHHLVMDIPIGIATIFLISGFMMVESVVIGGMVLALSFLFIVVIIVATGRIGRLGKFKEVLKQHFLRHNSRLDALKIQIEGLLSIFIERLTWSENKRLFWDNLISFCSFLLFRIIPALILLSFAIMKNMDVSSATSLLLSFNLLHRPFLQLVNLYKQTILFYAQSSLIRPDIEAGLLLQEMSHQVSRGLILARREQDGGMLLKKNEKQDYLSHSVFFARDDIEYWIDELKKLAHNRTGPMLLYLDDFARYGDLGHFKIDPDGELRVGLVV